MYRTTRVDTAAAAFLSFFLAGKNGKRQRRSALAGHRCRTVVPALPYLLVQVQSAVGARHVPEAGAWRRPLAQVVVPGAWGQGWGRGGTVNGRSSGQQRHEARPPDSQRPAALHWQTLIITAMQSVTTATPKQPRSARPSWAPAGTLSRNVSSPATGCVQARS